MGGEYMDANLINTIKKFIEVCEELHQTGKISDQRFEELARNKIDFLNNIEKARKEQDKAPSEK